MPVKRRSPTQLDAEIAAAIDKRGARSAHARVKDQGLDVELARVDEHGVHFETGVPVTFPFIRNTEKSPRVVGFGQDIEPHGRYLLHNSIPIRTRRGAGRRGRSRSGRRS